MVFPPGGRYRSVQEMKQDISSSGAVELFVGSFQYKRPKRKRHGIVRDKYLPVSFKSKKCWILARWHVFFQKDSR